MKVICVADKYRDICLKGIVTINKIYDVYLDSSINSPNFKQIFKIKCDDNVYRGYPGEVLMTIDVWREKQLNKLLI